MHFTALPIISFAFHTYQIPALRLICVHLLQSSTDRSHFASEYNRDKQLEREDDLKQRSSPSGHQSPYGPSPTKSPQHGAYSASEAKLGDSGELSLVTCESVEHFWASVIFEMHPWCRNKARNVSWINRKLLLDSNSIHKFLSGFTKIANPWLRHHRAGMIGMGTFRENRLAAVWKRRLFEENGCYQNIFTSST